MRLPQPSGATGPGLVLDILRRTGPKTRGDLQAATGVSRVTLTGRIQALQEAGLVVEEASLPTRGRPRNCLAFNLKYGYFAVEAMETTHARTAITDLFGEVIICRDSPADVRAGPERSLDSSVKSMRNLAAEAGLDLSQLKGVGVSLPGPIDPVSGRPSEPPIMPGWDGYPVAEYLEQGFGVTALVENDANAMALGVQRWSHPEAAALLLIKAGTGIGSGLVVGGELYRGVDGGAGDIGHIRLADSGDEVCRCGATGCLASFASGWAVAKKLAAEGIDARTGHDVRDLLDEGNPLALGAVLEAGRDLGKVGASLISMINPDVLVLAGDMASSALLSGFRESMYARTLPRATRHLRIELSLGADDAIHGVAQALADRVFRPDVVNAALVGSR